MIELELTPELLSVLNLPAEGVTAETFTAALTALAEQAKGGADATAQVATLQEQLDKMTLAEKERLQTALDAELDGYELGGDERGILGGMDAAARAKLLPMMPKKAAAPVVPAVVVPPAEVPKPKIAPPMPVHDPKGKSQVLSTDQARTSAIKDYRKAHPGVDFAVAWDSVRREKPELFQGA